MRDRSLARTRRVRIGSRRWNAFIVMRRAISRWIVRSVKLISCDLGPMPSDDTAIQIHRITSVDPTVIINTPLIRLFHASPPVTVTVTATFFTIVIMIVIPILVKVDLIIELTKRSVTRDQRHQTNPTEDERSTTRICSMVSYNSFIHITALCSINYCARLDSNENVLFFLKRTGNNV